MGLIDKLLGLTFRFPADTILIVKRAYRFIFAIVICEGVGVLSSIFTIPAISTWYQVLNKPSFSPPNFIFAPVWIMLYALMGISLVLAIQKASKKKFNIFLSLFGFQLLLNFLWSLVFFGLHQPIFGLIDILALWGSIFYLIIIFWKASRLASYLLMPYLFWVSFATLLNISIVLLNK